MPIPDAARIVLDGSCWASFMDFYWAVLKAIEAPEWHGYSADVLNDSMVFGAINGREPPYDLLIVGLRSSDVAHEIEIFRETLAYGRAELRAQRGMDAEVSIRVEGQQQVI